ncbi:EpsI family protein [Desulfovibrio mangrovi]|uniref:exosortase C-terminal domain/associated protein EpsI n=1 Tax=Desulfovibrio mangrovi TaxID=2976983 RepID=UPI002246A8B3|nr:exosortase C-terminal domain/associated protein EpsI [Desulfovibrio mangrovi]UZP67549.1 EpsI family protein [Desulfovibrio mangrovi]
MRNRAILLSLLLVAFGVLGGMRSAVSTPSYIPFATFPAQLGEWMMQRSFSMTDGELRILQLSDYMLRRYASRDGAVVDLYVGYHGGGEETGPVHSPKNCLPGSGWLEQRIDTVSLALEDGQNITAMRAVYGKDGNVVVFYYWFDVLGVSYVDEFSLKFAEIMGVLLHNRRDALLVRVSVPTSGDVQVDNETVQSFVREFYPVLRQFIPV